MPTYDGIGETITHKLEIEGDLFLQDIEGGTNSTQVPLEIFSDFETSGPEAINSRMLRLRVQNYGETNVSNSYVTDFGIHGEANKDYFFITAPQNTSNVGDQNTFVISSTSNVGIGTTDPGHYRLLVNKDSTKQFGVPGNDAPATGDTLVYNDDGEWVYSFPAGNLPPGTVLNEILTWNGDNWVPNNSIVTTNSNTAIGIGTYTPSSNLHVIGSVTATSDVNIAGAYQGGKLRLGTALNPVSANPNVTVPGDLTVSGTLTSDEWIHTTDVTITGNVGVTGTITTSNIVANSGESLLLNSSLFVDSTNGNVGIGTTDPVAKLDVMGSNNNGKSLQLRSGDSGGTDSSQVIFSYNGNPYNSTGYAHSIRTRHNSGANTGNAIDFWLWNTSDTANQNTLGNKRVMTIEGTGNVGVGTITPRTTLDVFGDLRCPSNEAQRTLSGGGTVTWNNSGYIKWTVRLILVPVDNVFYNSSGYIDIICPTSGTIPLYLNDGTTSTVTCTSDGIPISNWRSLYYVIEKGQTTSSNASRFRVVEYQNNTNIKIDSNWVYICGRNGNGTDRLKWMAGPTTLPLGATYGTVAWTAPTLLNSWVNYGGDYIVSGYYKDENGRVHITGLIKNGTNNTIFTLPSGFRPSGRLLFVVQNNNAVGRIDITSAGAVISHSGNDSSWISLDGISFLSN